MEILIIFFLILLNGVFSMSEIALISARKNRLESASKKGNKNAQIALDLANSPNKFLSTVQIGITLIGILTGIYSGDKITKDVELFISSVEILKPFSHPLSVGIVVLILTFFSLVSSVSIPRPIIDFFKEKYLVLYFKYLDLYKSISKLYMYNNLDIFIILIF